MKVVQIDDTFRIYGDDLKSFDKLPAQTYSVRFSKNSGWYLEKHADIEIKESKIYGVHMEKVNKVLNAFNEFNKNLGIILSGNKGIGKSLFAKELSIQAIGYGIPVIIVDTYIPGIADYLESIRQEVVILFDEFDKTFGGVKAPDGMADPQTELLTLFDGLSTGKKCFVITCNNMRSLNEFLINRPGRFHYHFRFEYPTAEEITEYLHDKLNEKYYDQIEAVISFANKVNLNYDCLKAIAYELNHGDEFKEAIKDLNIINVNDINYVVTLYLKDGRHANVTRSVDMFDRSGEFSCDSFYIGNTYVNASCKIMDVTYDKKRYVDVVNGEFVSLKPSYYDDDDDSKKEVEKMEADYMTFVRETDKNIHYMV